ncbi:ubiquitin carboxyl-terminal hydrolase [Halteromyces radiatus]|uniref:ubiquitin carboxyl-terminal hydrolase n=1 Tax=Halteromyces radiatus TaxID=101107 RepID=UPI002220CFD9|nr:ubiquitin carboxyl-terminal hydrolase [Halteromyces radiatus]KAI8096844.1 ubiquitin carboxyl-terminal hydrolase [Halteromyces radiatus]
MTLQHDLKYGVYPPWCLIESKPETFSTMAHMYGVQDVIVEEIYDIDNLLVNARSVYGLILASPLDSKAPFNTICDKEDADGKSLFFSCQIVTNVCATSALLGILLNNEDNDLNIGPHLREFKEFTKDFSPIDKGLAIAGHNLLRTTHNTFGNYESRLDALQYPRYDDIKPTKKGKRSEMEDERYHYIAFVPANGFIWELDGYNKTPVKICPISENWLKLLQPELKKRMHRSDALQFSLLSVTKANTPTTEKSSIPPPLLSTISASPSTSSSSHSQSLRKRPKLMEQSQQDDQNVEQQRMQLNDELRKASNARSCYIDYVGRIERNLDDFVGNTWRIDTLEKFKSSSPPLLPDPNVIDRMTNQEDVTEEFKDLVNKTLERTRIKALIELRSKLLVASDRFDRQVADCHQKLDLLTKKLPSSTAVTTTKTTTTSTTTSTTSTTTIAAAAGTTTTSKPAVLYPNAGYTIEESKLISRLQHDYNPLLRAIFEKLHDKGLMNDL